MRQIFQKTISGILLVLLLVGMGWFGAGKAEAQELTITLDDKTVVVNPHPRLWIRDGDIARLQEKAQAGNWAWEGLEYENNRAFTAEEYIASVDPLMAFNFAVGYMATGNTNWRDAAKTIMLNLPSLYQLSYANNDYGSIALIYYAVAYDWLYHGFTPGERTTICNWVYGTLYPFLRDPNSTHGRYVGSVTHNLGHTKWIGELMWSLATLEDDVRAEVSLQEQYDYCVNRFLPLCNQYLPGGRIWCGSDYGPFRSYKYILYGMEALDTALNLNFYNEHQWPNDNIYYWIYSTHPGAVSYYSYYWGSSDLMFDPYGYRAANLPILIKRYQGSNEARYGQYYVNRVRAPSWLWRAGKTFIHRYYSGLWFFWYDPGYQESDYTITLPTSYHVSGLGLFLSRSNWLDNATWIALADGVDFIGDHQLNDAGSYKIYKNGHLIIQNSGQYSVSYQAWTAANIMFLGDGIAESGAITGGLSWSHGLKGFPVFKSDDINHYTYALADLTKAYYQPKFPLNYFHRQMVHLKPEPGQNDDYIIVHDRIDEPNAVSKKSYIHFVKNITLNGTMASTTSVGDTSKVLMQTLLPSSANIYVESVTDNAGMEGDQPTRLVVQTPSNVNYAQFMHLYYLTENINAQMPQATEIKATTNNMSGVWLDQSNKLVMFAKTNSEINEAITYTIQGQSASKHLIVDLKPNTQFTITGTNLDTGQVVQTQTKTSSSQGTLYFEATLGSNHRITITPAGPAPVRGDVNGDRLVNVVDVQLAVNQFLGVLPQTQEADLNGDEVVNVIDVQLVVNIILGR